MALARRRTVLVIDDDRDVLQAIDEVLADEGYHVLSATNGAQALAVLGNEKVDLILLDLLMPTMNGHEFLETTADPRFTSTPIILISAAPEGSAPGANVRAVLQKPFDRGVLLDAVASSLVPA